MDPAGEIETAARCGRPSRRGSHRPAQARHRPTRPLPCASWQVRRGTGAGPKPARLGVPGRRAAVVACPAGGLQVAVGRSRRAAPDSRGGGSRHRGAWEHRRTAGIFAAAPLRCSHLAGSAPRAPPAPRLWRAPRTHIRAPAGEQQQQQLCCACVRITAVLAVQSP